MVFLRHADTIRLARRFSRETLCLFADELPRGRPTVIHTVTVLRRRETGATVNHRPTLLQCICSTPTTFTGTTRVQTARARRPVAVRDMDLPRLEVPHPSTISRSIRCR